VGEALVAVHDAVALAPVALGLGVQPDDGALLPPGLGGCRRSAQPLLLGVGGHLRTSAVCG
jgi:hypothetical protein